MKQEDEADGEVASMALLRRHLEAVAEKGSEVTLFLLYKPPLISGATKGCQEGVGKREIRQKENLRAADYRARRGSNVGRGRGRSRAA